MKEHYLLRFLVVFWLISVSTASANDITQAQALDDVIISIDLRNTKLVNALSEIESQTEYQFAYDERVLKLKSDISVTSPRISVKEVLLEISRQADVGFQRVNNQIDVKIIKKSEPVRVIETPADVDLGGRITDENNEPLPGASILVKGTAIGTTSDVDGNYSLTVPDDAVVIYSFVGYLSQEVVVGNQSRIDIKMELDVAQLQEVVVTALGIEKEQKTLGYATSKVAPEEFTVNRSPVFMDALQGKVAGVNITKMGSGPQGSSKIRIRGVSSFGGNNSPLIVVNGVPIDNTNFGVSGDVSEVGSNRNSDSGDGLSSINPDDIVSMNVLKGAAASALYGSRAKDGVIMITTRNRAEGEGIKVEWNVNYTSDSPLDYTDYQYEYGQGEGGVRPDAPGPASGVWSFGEPMGGTQILYDGLVVPYEPQRNKVKDYYDTGYTLANTVTVSSGGENGGFSLSLSNMHNKTILPGSSYDRNTINLGFTQQISKLRVSGNLNYSNEDRQNPPNIAEQDFSPVVIYTLATSMPLDVLRDNCCDENGDEIRYSRFTNRTNPYFALKRFENNIRDRVYGNVTAKYDLTDWLYLQGRVGQDYWTRDVEYNLPTGSQRQSSPPPGFVNGQYIRDIRRFREINTDFLIGANREFGDFAVTLTGGGNIMYRRLDVNTELGELFFTRDLYTIQNASKVTPGYDISERQVNSLYGAAEVGWKDMLFLNATVRNDWFSTLSPENRSILYPSVTGSWVFSQSFSNLPDWITFGKLRLAYAQVGSDTDVSPYSNNLFYSISAQQFPGPTGTPQPVGQISGATVPNSNLKPMDVTEKEIGIELNLFDNLRFEMSYYDKISDNQILSAQVSDASGFTSQLINVGESKNQGIELFASYSPIKGDKFEWNISANATHNTSEVLSLGDDVDGTSITVGGADFHGELRQVVGKPMAQLYGWGYLRDDHPEESTNGQLGVTDGRIVYDSDNGRPMRSREQLNYGSALPVWWGGFGNTLTFGKLSFYFLIDFKLGHKMISGTHTNAYRHGLDKATLVGRDVGFVVGDGVNPDGSENTTQSDIQPFYETIRSFRMSEQSVFNAGSWQLRQMSLGYDLTDLIPQNKYISAVRLNIVANNVAVLKKWVPHIHPDQNGIIDDNRAGLEATGLPITRSIGFNLNVRF
ncbi:MAG: SusC/RagA family TonB-linked outer membrane protein [Cyclobacteriaceae bacterium]|nr:MAG: SusC/RagA family TonB-linked outer membrane protein [Cyclobacteriaceae bacterium]